MQVPLPNGKTVPLSQIASVEYGQEYPIIWRRDRLPTVTVQADLAPGTQAATVVQALAPKMAALNASLPNGYRVSVGGSVEESDKAQTSVVAVVPLMLVIMLTVLMIQLQSFSRMILVLSVAPMGVIGVVAALLLADKPLGFVAILGVLALTGMIARNSVILIDQIEKDKAKGYIPGMRSLRPPLTVSARSCSPLPLRSSGWFRSRRPCSGVPWPTRSWAAWRSRRF